MDENKIRELILIYIEISLEYNRIGNRKIFKERGVMYLTNEKITGIMVYYYFVCKRKLWLSCNGISMESENENVQVGKFLDENAYSNRRKHILINNEINLDFIEGSGIIHEIKKSRKIEEASIWQVKYYLYYLQKNGLDNIRAEIDYPLLKQRVDVELTENDKVKLEEVLDEIVCIMNRPCIPVFSKNKACKKCAFFDLCAV